MVIENVQLVRKSMDLVTAQTEEQKLALDLVRVLRNAGFQAYWVGGCVRDLVMGRQPTDYDISTDALPDQVEALFPKTVPVGKSFGVVEVVLPPYSFQVTTFRAEEVYGDGRHPARLRFTKAPWEDAIRRDFTVNGLFYDPLEKELYDWVGGIADINARIIRTIGDPEKRFAEDYLRLLRAARFAAQLDFSIEERTWRAVCSHHSLIKNVSAERIRDELKKLLKSPYAARGLLLLRDSSLLSVVIPEVTRFAECEQPPEYHPEGNLFNHVVRMLELLPLDHHPLLPWVVLLHDVGKPIAKKVAPDGAIHFHGHDKIGEAITREILTRLRFTRAETETVCWVVGKHMVFKDVPKMRPETRRKLLLHPDADLLLELFRLDRLSAGQPIDLYETLVKERNFLLQTPQLRQPLLRGRDLLKLGFEPGPLVGQALRIIREKQLAGELRSREEALSLAKTLLRDWHSGNKP